MTTAFDKTPAFGSVPNEDVNAERFSTTNPDTVVEEFCPNDVATLLRDVTYAEDVKFDAKNSRFVVDLPYGMLYVRPDDGTAEWSNTKAQKELYCELRIEDLRVRQFSALNQLQQRYSRCKIYTNNSDQLCIGMLLSVEFGVACEQVEYLLGSFLEEAILIKSSDELISSVSLDDIEHVTTGKNGRH